MMQVKFGEEGKWLKEATDCYYVMLEEESELCMSRSGCHLPTNSVGDQRWSGRHQLMSSRKEESRVHTAAAAHMIMNDDYLTLVSLPPHQCPGSLLLGIQSTLDKCYTCKR